MCNASWSFNKIQRACDCLLIYNNFNKSMLRIENKHLLFVINSF